MIKKSPNPIDVHVGGRVRVRRILMNLSQEKLGDKIALTFQQVQKYEKGMNRISASKLYEIARALEVPVHFFFEGISVDGDDTTPGFAEGGGDGSVVDFLHTAEGLRLNKAFVEIDNPAVRRKIVELVRALSAKPSDYDET
jgi:transcriptional regulator with XRE-family HTH domain